MPRPRGGRHPRPPAPAAAPPRRAPAADRPGVAARALGELAERAQDRLADEPQDRAHHARAELDDAPDRVGEDLLGAVPDAAEAEEVAPAQRVEEGVDRVPDESARDPERLQLL